MDAVSAEVDELAGQREPSGSPADVLRERREARRAKGETVAYSHAEARGTNRHG
ncbi:MAG TPA: hypothetical protein VLL82_11075 [Mycobacterium sp.]|nr:hypothetical protein [Mycobacterium sp.]